MSSGRLLRFEVNDAATNMAVDEVILDSLLHGRSGPTLRFYDFAPAAISIGYAQRLAPEVMKRARKLGYDVVRRPTGGRAVLHLNALTYSFVGLVGDGRSEALGVALSSSVMTAYRQICAGLITGLQEIDVRVELGATAADSRQPADCFLAVTGADLHFRGKKLIGSAQLRRQNGVLQHGCLLLEQDQTAMNTILSGEANGNPPKERHANLFQILGERLPIEQLEAALVVGFEKAFAMPFAPGNLTAFEKQEVAALRNKYATIACVAP